MKTIRLIMVAVGGQGNLLASRVLGRAALIANVSVKMSEIHGMAQRGGVVESAIVFGDAASYIISDGEADIMLGFEPAETLRAIKRCNKNTEIIMSTSMLPPFTAAIGKGVYPDIKEVKTLLKKKCSNLICIDAMQLANNAGNAMSLNIVMLGALIADFQKTKILNITKQNTIDAIKQVTKKAFLETNLKAFELGHENAKLNL